MAKMSARGIVAAFLAVAASGCGHANAEKSATPQCAPLDMSGASLAQLKAAEFEFEDAGLRAAFLLAVADCLEHPSPEVRDGVAYEAVTAILRSGDIGESDLRLLLGKLTSMMKAPADAAGFRRPFAALALAEVARTDRIKAWMTPAERTGLAGVGTDYLSSIDDYRGFSETEGWRHGVAHTADLLMQLSLNPALGPADARLILDAVFAKAAPDEHFYIYGEPGRLARPVLFLAMRDDVSVIDWSARFGGLTAGFATNADDVFNTQAGLARRNNVTAFASEIFIAAETSEDGRLTDVGAAAREALRAVP